MKKTKKILIVEDNHDLLDLYVELLKGEGYKITTAEDGKLALSILKNRKEQLDLLLIDEIIPKIQGTELIQILKDSKEILKPKHIILMTNLDKSSVESKLKSLKCKLIDRYIIKSDLTPNEFIEIINSTLKN